MLKDYNDDDALTRRTFVGRGAVGVGALGLFLAGCGGGSSSEGSEAGGIAESGGPATDGDPVKGGTLRIGFVSGGPAETISLLTAGLAATADFARVYALYDPLVVPTPGGKVGPGLAESWEPNGDATSWTFKLRTGVSFHNGKELTADDVVYTIRRSWASSKNIFNGALATLIDFGGVRKLDASTVQVPLKFAVADFPSVICLPQCYIAQDGTSDFGDGNGTGPFTLDSFRPGQRSTFAANPNYWQEGRPYVSSLVIDSSYNNDQDRFNALLAGDIDIAPSADIALTSANAENGRIVIGNQPGPGFINLSIRADKGVFADPRVRKAVHLMPDRQQNVDVALRGYATVGNDCPGTTNRYWAGSLKSEHDPEQARSLLKAAGREGLSVNLATSPVIPGMTETATLFKQQAKAAGMNVSIRTSPPSTYLTPSTGFLTRALDVEFFTTGVNSLATYYIVAGLEGGIYNVNNWGKGDATFGPDNSLLFDALGEQDAGSAEEKWMAVQRISHDSGPWVIPANTNWVDAYSPKVRGVQTTSVLSCGNYDFSGGWLAES